MKRIHLLFATLVATAALIDTSPDALADKEVPPYSYKSVSPNGKYVFVMIAPLPIDSDVQNWNDETGALIREIRHLYPLSGLYPNNGSNRPLWTVDWYAHQVEVASDGIHLIRHGPWASSTDQEALSFFANGQLLRAYPIYELVDVRLLLSHSISHFAWCKESEFDDERLQYTVSTYDGSQFVFDVRSGDIVFQIRLLRVLLWLVGAGIVAAVMWSVIKRQRGRIAGWTDTYFAHSRTAAK